jgi:hypothetical protein
MTPAGTGVPPYPVFRQALDLGQLQRVLNLAREMPRVSLVDALRIVELMAAADHERYERAAVKWLGRYATEGDGVTVDDVQRAATWLDALPDRPELADRLRGLVTRSA